MIAGHVGVLKVLQKSLIRNIAICLLTLTLSARYGFAHPGANPVAPDQRFVADVFDQEILSDNHAAICAKSRELNSELRYEYLSNWVLPAGQNSSIRLPIEFLGGVAASNSQPHVPDAIVSPATVVQLQSPALDLIQAAAECKKLDELHDRVLAIRTARRIDERCQRTLLILIDLESGRDDEAQQKLNEVLATLQAQNKAQFKDQGPELLALYQGLQHEATSDLARECLSYLLDSRRVFNVDSASSIILIRLKPLFAISAGLATGRKHCHPKQSRSLLTHQIRMKNLRMPRDSATTSRRTALRVTCSTAPNFNRKARLQRLCLKVCTYKVAGPQVASCVLSHPTWRLRATLI